MPQSQLPPEAAWSRHANAATEAVRRATTNTYAGRIALLSSFGSESAVLLHMVASVAPSTPVLFINTGKLFGETVRYRQTLASHLGLTDVRDVHPDRGVVAADDPDGLLFQRNADDCCRIRKVEPFAHAMQEFDAILTGRKRAHGGIRADLPLIEDTGDHVKINPLIHMEPDDLTAYMQHHDLPPHPLVADGFSSVGCYTCTTKTAAGEGVRDGRWRGQEKTECGIHLPPIRKAG